MLFLLMIFNYQYNIPKGEKLCIEHPKNLRLVLLL